MSKLTVEYLRHIADEIIYLNDEVSSGGEIRFMHDPTLQRAAARSMEIIGEAIKQVPENFRIKYPDIDWKSYAGLRDKLIHHYFGVDYTIVWDIIKNELPALEHKIKNIIKQESSTS